MVAVYDAIFLSEPVLTEFGKYFRIMGNRLAANREGIVFPR